MAPNKKRFTEDFMAKWDKSSDSKEPVDPKAELTRIRELLQKDPKNSQLWFEYGQVHLYLFRRTPAKMIRPLVGSSDVAARAGHEPGLPGAVIRDRRDPKGLALNAYGDDHIRAGVADIVEKMVEGRLRKEYFQQVVLMQQTFVIDGKASVEQAVKEAEKEVGAPIKIARFERFALGEGIEKKEDDFAAEVAAAAGTN